MNVKINKVSYFESEVSIPSSKSYAQRVLALALVCEGTTTIQNIGESDDVIAALSIVKEFGCEVEKTKRITRIKSKGLHLKAEKSICFSESGLSCRMFTPLLSNCLFPIELTGSGSLNLRPMNELDLIFRKLNLTFESCDGKLPFKICGPLVPIDIEIDGELSSQFATGMIYAYLASPNLRNETLKISKLNSRPYLELSLEIARKFGAQISLRNEEICFNGPYKLNPVSIEIERDWSSAAYFLVLGALCGRVLIRKMNFLTNQADIAILEVLKKFGANIIIKSTTIIVEKHEFKAFDFDATHCPDLFPILGVLASKANGISKIRGVNRLIHKESNRGIVMQKELGKFGVKIDIIDDLMTVEGNRIHNGAIVNSCGDHRIAMAATIQGLVSNGTTVIQNADAVNKSFPEFFSILTDYIES